MERFTCTLPPPTPSKVGPGAAIVLALAFGMSGPGWLIVAADAHYAPPRLLGTPVPALLPFVGVLMMLAGAAWFAALRAYATQSEVELVGLCLRVDGVDLQLDARSRIRRTGEQMQVTNGAGAIRVLRSSDQRALSALEARIRKRIAGAGTSADVPRAIRSLARE